MKAIVYYRYGPPEVLELQEVDQPESKDDEIMIKVHAAEATKADCELRKFKFPVKWFWLPLRIAVGITKPRRPILGGYFAGEVVRVGKEVEGLQVGSLVFGSAGLRMGAYGEFMCCSSSSTVVIKPSNMTFEQAAAVPLGGLNALHFMKRAQIKKGETVLINGAGGSIGLFAVQIAKHLGAEVTAVDSGIKQEMLQQIGVDHFINYELVDFTKEEKKYDVIFDMVATNSYSHCVQSLAPGGRYLLGNPRLMDMIRSVATGVLTDKEVIFAFAQEKKEELNELRQMIEDGIITSVVDKVYPMDQASAAHERVETEQRIGSVVIAIG